MSIRFPKWCKTPAQKSAHASKVASIRWEKTRNARGPAESLFAYIEFGGPLTHGKPIRLDLISVRGKRKWEGRSEGKSIGDFSIRTVLNTVKTILRNTDVTI